MTDGANATRFLIAGASDWEGARKAVDRDTPGEERASTERLSSFLLASLQMQNLLVLAGSGASLHVGGPTMGKLWTECVGAPVHAEALRVFATLKYGSGEGQTNIEDLLSRCDAHLLVNPDDRDVSAFRSAAIQKILTECRVAGSLPEHDLTAHKELLRRLARRRARDPRVKLFTTNYDLCFEKSASELGLVALDGFSFFDPRRFDPRYFEYDIVRRGALGSDGPQFVSGVFQYFKLHGSVNWASDAKGAVTIDAGVDAERACLIYPTREKYRFSFQQPHLELMAQFLSSLREPNTCLLVVSFGFNDDHLSEPIFSALDANPHLRVVVVSPRVEKHFREAATEPWRKLSALARRGVDVSFIAADFPRFADLVPDLRALSPSERLERAVRGLVNS
jgi:hypothetical protein